MTLGIVGVTFDHGVKLRLFLDSLVLQTCDDWKLFLYHDGPDDYHAGPWGDSDSMRELLQDYSHLARKGKIVYTATPERFNDFGHSLRALGLAACDTEYVNWQNCDNYLTPRFVELLLNEAESKNLDFAYCDILHNYPNVGGNGKGPYNVLVSHPQINHMDIANFIVRTEMAKDVGFNHRDFAADGLFIEEFMLRWGSVARIGKVESVLVVHN